MVLRDRADAPPIAGPRYGLLAVAPTEDDASLRWHGGYEFRSELGSTAHGFSALENCYEWANDPGMTTSTPGGLVQVDPVVVWAGDRCSTLGANRRDWQGLARRKLAAHQSADLALHAWENVIAPAVAPDIVDATPGGAASPQNALACLEQRLHDELWGPTGYVHMNVGVFTQLAQLGSITRDGTRWVTPMGTVVIADAGYNGSGPLGAGGVWMVGTGPVRVRLGPVETSPGPGEGMATVVDRAANTAVVLAWRAALVEVDKAAHVAAQATATC